MAPDAPATTDPGIVLYDGVCGFCDGAVRWLLARDDAGLLRFAPLQGETAAALRARHPEIPEGLDNVVFVTSGADGERVYLRSSAVFELLERAGGRWRVLRWLRWLPVAVTDFGYGMFARARYRMFGRIEACRIPEPDERARFLA